VIIFIVLWVIGPCQCVNTEQKDGSRDILRVNHGLNFKFIKEFTPISGYWYHSFIVPVPQDVFNSTKNDIILGDKSENSRRRWLDECLNRQFNEMEGHPEKNGVGSSDVVGRQSLCVKYAPMIRRMLKMVKDDHVLLKKKIRSINELLPLDIENLANKEKRGVLDVVGDIGHSLFGFATDRQIKVVEGHVKELAETYKAQTSI
jgi:hypothetical protein